MKALVIALLLSAATLSAPALRAAEILIRDAKVHTVSVEGTREHTDVLIHDDRIAAIGARLTAPGGATVIEANNRPLTPGLFGGLTVLGLVEVMAEPENADGTFGLGAPAWQQQWRPELDVTLAFNPRSVVIPVTRIEGVTWTVLNPSSSDSIISGQGAAVTLDGRFDAALAGSRTLFVSLGGGATNAGGSRAGQYMLLDQAIREVKATATPHEGALLHAAGKAVLRQYLAGGRVAFGVDRAADIRQVVAFARRAGMKPVIVGGSEAWMIARELATANIPVIISPLQNLPDSFDELGARLDCAALLHHAGVRVAFSGDSYNARNIRQLAGNAVAHGLPWEAALAAITAVPADIFGLGATHGRIAVGQTADVVLWSGDPLEVTTIADRVWIAGRAVEMRSRQTELRDRYAKHSSPN